MKEQIQQRITDLERSKQAFIAQLNVMVAQVEEIATNIKRHEGGIAELKRLLEEDKEASPRPTHESGESGTGDAN